MAAVTLHNSPGVGTCYDSMLCVHPRLLYCGPGGVLYGRIGGETNASDLHN